jgi:pimeloyl-ACP methyl ester carboxylesterase
MTEFVEFGTLRGELTRAADDWIVLVHESGRDLDGWKPVVSDLARLPLTVLAFDLRGHGGSDGSPGSVEEDVHAALEFARAGGARSVLVAAAGDSVAPSLTAAETAGGFVALGPTGAPVAAPRLPRLIVVASRDEEQVAAAASLRAGGGWAVVVNIPTSERGLELLAGAWGTGVRSHMLVFVKDLLTVAVR